jgi:HrpA-like RNA helicase
MISKGEGSRCRILCSQPRRIAATGLASRVATERCESVGQTVGYAIRMDTKRSDRTRLMFCTVGVALRLLASDPNLSEFSHIIVDEVHERSIETDIFLLLLRRLIQRRKDLKVILMSASVNAEFFLNYFSNVSECLPSPSVFHIDGKAFPVKEFFIEEIFRMSEYPITNKELIRSSSVSKESRNLSEKDESSLSVVETPSSSSSVSSSSSSSSSPSLSLIEKYSRFDDTHFSVKVLVHVIQWLHEVYLPSMSDSILVFLPGSREIYTTKKALEASLSSAIVLPLHSSLSSSEQQRVFLSPPPSNRKIILSTNVAETSVTIDDIVVVVDTGRMREMEVDPQSELSILQNVWAPKDSLTQRRGRAGRVREGVCLRLFTRERFQSLPPAGVAEIHRIPLDRTCLDVLSLGIGDPVKVRFAQKGKMLLISMFVHPGTQ